jgi:hypothetical protein
VALRACLRYIHSLRRLDHAISFYFVRAYEEFGSPRSLAMSQSFVVLGCRLFICFCGTHLVVGCYDCVLLRIFNLVFRALACSPLFSDAFANGGL